MAMITNDWLPAVREEFAKPYYRQLYQFVKEEYSRTVVYPPAEDIFNALHFTPLSEVKVLILGQDPYHNEHQAHGLSFSVLPDQKEIPPSLQNIYKELQDDLGCKIPNNGYLKKWADQGVLLLNTVLTVRAHQANSHQGRGWEQFTDAIIQAVNAFDHQNILLTKLHIMSVIFPFSGLEIERRKLNPFSCKQLFQIVIKKFHIQCFQTLIIRLSFCVQRCIHTVLKVIIHRNRMRDQTAYPELDGKPSGKCSLS